MLTTIPLDCLNEFFNPLMNLLSLTVSDSHLRLPHMKVVNKVGRYTSYRIVGELLSILGDEVKTLVQVRVWRSLFVRLIVNDSA